MRVILEYLNQNKKVILEEKDPGELLDAIIQESRQSYFGISTSGPGRLNTLEVKRVPVEGRENFSEVLTRSRNLGIVFVDDTAHTVFASLVVAAIFRGDLEE